ncbi:hypothetical protein ACS0TY_004955 [Phlomoides rotata]
MDFLQILILCFLPLSHSVNTLNHKLIYTNCSNQTSPHSVLLPSLFDQFISKSSKSSFFETIVADDRRNIAISGGFQCRGDISLDECTACVRKLPVLSSDLCGKKMPARIQLAGCYARYQEDEAKIATNTGHDGDQILHRACSKRKVNRSGFEEMKYAAFASLESCVVGGDGFCETKYESIRVLAQCGGSLRSCDCGECVSSAVQIVGDDHECKFAVSGEIYLDGCFISYDYYGSRVFGTFTDEGNKSVKLIAIAVGGLVVVSIGIGLCYFISSCGKKDDW